MRSTHVRGATAAGEEQQDGSDGAEGSEALQTRAGGYVLHLSARSKTGYKGVYFNKLMKTTPYLAQACGS